MIDIVIIIRLIRLNHGLHHLLTPIFYPSFTSLVMRIYNQIEWRNISRFCSATQPFRTTKPKIRILGIVVREGCVALHYSVHFFFTNFLFRATIVIEGEGIGARSVRFPHRLCVCPTRSRKGGEGCYAPFPYYLRTKTGRASLVLEY